MCCRTTVRDAKSYATYILIGMASSDSSHLALESNLSYTSTTSSSRFGQKVGGADIPPGWADFARWRANCACSEIPSIFLQHTQQLPVFVWRKSVSRVTWIWAQLASYCPKSELIRFAKMRILGTKTYVAETENADQLIIVISLHFSSLNKSLVSLIRTSYSSR